jgi:lycopene beta-cyclase
MNGRDYDVIIAGGGLAGTLAAYRLRQVHPAARVLLLEEGTRLGGNHTWSFHDTDIAPEARAWIAPFVAHRWPQQQVRFPKYTRMLALGYNTVFAESLHRAALPVLGENVRFEAAVRAVEPHRVELANGEELRDRCAGGRPVGRPYPRLSEIRGA